MCMYYQRAKVEKEDEMTSHTRTITYIGKGNSSSNSNLSKCAKCGEEFSLYIDIVTKRCGSHKRKRYHIKCAKELNII